jgi:nucleotide-binding universal stress UspA family protein
MSEHIMIATDGSELSQRGIDLGLSLAKSMGARVTVVTVTEGYPVPLDMRGMGVVVNPELLAQHRDAQGTHAAEVLGAAAKRAEAAGMAIDTLHVPDAIPAEALLSAAADRKATMLVMASHGRRGLKRLLLGSQTAEVLAHSTIPVLVVR